MQYFQVKITNTSGFSDDKVWIIAKGKEFDYQPPEPYETEESFFQFDAEGKASFFHPTEPGMSLALFTKNLSTFPKDPANAGVYLLSFPHTDSGRIYFSIGKGVTFSIVVGYDGANKPVAMSIADPAAAEPTDPNYAVIYDKVEFSYDKKDTIWFNTTAVDFISMPITITPNSLEEKKGITVGLSKTRSDIIDGFNNGLKGQYWPKLKLVYPVTGTVLRIVAPNHGKDFNKNYLDAYLKAIWNYYYKDKDKDHQIKVDCSELKDSNGTSLYGTFTGKAEQGESGPFRFYNDNNPAEECVEDITLPTSDQAFGCAGGHLDAPNNTPKAVIVRGLTAAINVGLLPILSEGTPVLNRQFFEDNQANFYKDNQNGDNPWYNLYSKILHSFGDKVYAFAYDDAVGQDSTLSIPNNQNAFIAVKLNKMDMSDKEIPDPDHDDENSYTITFSPGLNGSGSMFNPNDQETHKIPTKQATTVNNVKSPFKLTYKILKEEEVTYDVYVGLRTAYASNGQALGIGWGGSGNSITMALPGKKGPDDK